MALFALNLSVKGIKKLKGITKNKKLIFAAAAVIVLAAAAAFICTRPSASAKSESGAEYSTVIEDEDYSAFFSQLGIDAEEKPSEEKTVIVPYEFNGVYSGYNGLQKQAGLDLYPYRGTEARRLVFALRNAKARYAVLLVRDGRVIGGHLTNGEYGGEDLPLI